MQIKKNSKPEQFEDTDHSNLTSNYTPLSSSGNAVTDEERQRMVAEAAYFRAEKRGFREGDVQQDWIEAEAEIGERLQQGL